MNNFLNLDIKNIKITFLTGLLIFLGIFYFGGMSQIFNGFMYAQLDSIYPISEYANLSLFGVNNNLSLNLAGYYIHSLDRYFLFIANLFEIKRNVINNIHIFFVIITFYSFTFYIFTKTFKKLDTKEIFILTFYFTLSPYLIIFIDGGSFYTISTILAIAAFPVLIKYCIEFESCDYRLVLSLFFLISSSIIFLGPVLIIGLVWLYINFNKIIAVFNTKKNIVINLAITIIVFFPFILFLYLYLDLVSNNDLAEYNSNGMSGAIRGHIFIPLMQIHSWAYYNFWEPRVVANFYETFNTTIYKILSLTIAVIVIFVLAKAKSYRALMILAIGVIFAKGESGFLSSIYIFFRESPIGFIIRTPDTKFGLVILSVYIYTLYIAERKLKYFLGLIVIIFTIYNINQIYLKGGISPSTSNSNLTAFYKYDNYDKLINIINDKNYDNYLVITNSYLCEGRIINNKFSACSDIILKNSNKQVITTESDNIDYLYKNIEKNIQFPSLLLIDKNLFLNKVPSKDFLNKYGFNEIYSDDYYDLFEKKIENNCTNKYKFGCYNINSLDVVSANEKYLKFNGFEIKGKYNEFFIVEKNSNTNKKNYLLFLFDSSLIISYLICLIILTKRFTP
jgi:hypothetical protein